MRCTSPQITLGTCIPIALPCSDISLLKGAELCHLKKPVKACFGGGARYFVYDEAQSFAGIEIKSTFLSGMERSLIVKQMMDMIRSPPGGLHFTYSRTEQRLIRIPEGRAVGT